jgi:hypothetical protein
MHDHILDSDSVDVEVQRRRRCTDTDEADQAGVGTAGITTTSSTGSAFENELTRAVQSKVLDASCEPEDESVSCGRIRGFSEVNGTRQLVEGECDRIAGSSARIRGQLDSVRLCILPSCRSYPAILYPESDPARSYTPSPQRVKSFFDGGKLSPTRIECRGACDVVCTRERLGMQPDCHPVRNAIPTILLSGSSTRRELNRSRRVEGTIPRAKVKYFR